MVWAGQISQEEAAEIAARFTNNQPQLSRMHKAPRKAGNMRLAHKAMQNNSEEAAFYVFNQENNNGFVIVSADDRTASEVLGYGENGSFDFDRINPNLRWWLSRYADEITALQTIDDSEFDQSPIRKADQVTEIKNLLKNRNGKEITWYQESPYSDLCPMDERDNTRCLTGCVATAASQIMYKWEWPKKGTGTASYTWYDCLDDDCNNYKSKTLKVEPGNTTYDWDNMLPAYEGKSATSAQKTAVATLMYHAGVAAKMGYGGDATGGSGAWTDDMGYALVTYFGYKLEKFVTMYASKSKYQSAKNGNVANITAEFGVSREQIKAYFNADLEAGRPIIMGGEGTKGGHEFVCCGRNTSNQFYINWGWEGQDNGYFELSALKPGSYNFSSNLDAIIGLEPKEAGHAVVTNGTGCTIAPSANFAANDEAFTATIEPTDGTYDFSSITVKLGNTTLTKTTHYTLSSDNKTLTIKASAITGDYSNSLTITAVWTKNRYKYELLGENSTPEMDEGMLAKNAALNLTIQPASGYTLNNAACWDVEMGGNKLTYGTGFTYNASSGAFAIAQVTGDVNILVYGGKEVTWKASGTTFATTFTSADKYVLPTSNPEIECDGKEFVGWCATADYSSETTAPAFIQNGDAATKGNIFYAVFAKKGEGGGVENTKYTFNSKSWGDATNSWSSDKDGGQLMSGQGVQVTTGASGAGATTKSSVTNVSKVVVNYCTNKSAGAGSVKITVGGTEKSLDVTSSGGTSLRDLEFTFDKVSGKVSIEVTCSTNSIYINAITLTTGGGVSYSDYVTTCTPPCEGTLTGITLNTESVKKTFTEGETFNYDGLVVTANIDGCEDKTVKPTEVSSPDMSQIGKQEITVTYEGKSAKYEITIEALPTYAIRFFNNGEQVGTTQNVKKGQAATKPASDPTACDDYTFGGWYTATLSETNTEKPSYVTDFTATKDQDYYAVFSMSEEGESSSTTIDDQLTRATTGVTKDATTYSNWSGKSVTSEAVYAGNSAGGSDAIQIRSNNSNSGIITTKSGGKIKKVTVSWNSSTADERQLNIYGKTTTYSAASDLYGANAGTLLGSIVKGKSTELTITGNYTYVGVCSNSGAMYLDAITFTWEAGSAPSSTTYYTTAPNCVPCTAKVNVTKGTASHGSFSLDKTGEQSTCGGPLVVTVTVTPDEGYRFKEITQTGIEDADIDQDAKTVTYAKKADGASTINVAFEAIPKYTVRFYSNGNMIKTQDLYAGNKAEKPADPSADCTDYTFVGWYTEELPEANTEKPSYVTDFTATKDQDYYAIYSKTEKSEGGASASVTFKNAGSESTTDASSTAGSIKKDLVDTESGIASYGGSKVYASPYGAKLGSSKLSGELTMTLSSPVTTKTITINAKLYGTDTSTSLSVTVNDDVAFGSAQKPSEGGGILTFTGSETAISSISITTSSKRAYIKSVTIGSASSSVTYYTSTVTCHGSGTSIEDASQNEPVAIKAIMNGQIVIIRGEAVYTLTGARVQ